MAKPPMAPGTPAGKSEQPRVHSSQRDLYFPLPIESNVENTVEFTNMEDSIVLFKVKTSEAARYVVRPKVGLVQPRGSVKVRFVLLASHYADEAKKDRFSVHLRFAQRGEDLTDPAACWAKNKDNAARIQLACMFTPKDELPRNIKSRFDQPAATSGAKRDQSQTPRGPSAAATDVSARDTPASRAASPAGSPIDAGHTLSGAAAVSRVGRAQARAATELADPAANKLSAQRTKARDAIAGALPASQAPAAKTTSEYAPPKPPGSSGYIAPPKAPGTRRSAFAQAAAPVVPLIVVIPLMVACVCIGAYSEHWMHHVEAVMQALQHFWMTMIMRPVLPVDSAPGAATTA